MTRASSQNWTRRWLPLMLLLGGDFFCHWICEGFSFRNLRNRAIDPSAAFANTVTDSKCRTALFTATSSPKSRMTIDGRDDDIGASSSSTFQGAFIEDARGHINPELAQRIFRWERAQRLNLQVRSNFSTRQGLRWVQDIVAPHAKNSKNYNDDILQEGVVALMQAMSTYEHEARPNQTFEHFAKDRVRRAIEDYQVHNKLASSTNSRKSALSVESTVEITDPLETHYSNQDEWEVREGLVLDNGQTVKRDELVADFLDETMQYEGEDQMWVHQQQVVAPLRDSIPAQEDDSRLWLLMDDDDGTDLRRGAPDLSLDDLALRDMIMYNVDEFLDSTLDDLESQVIQLRFGLDSDLPKTHKEVAFDLGLTVSKVRKIQKEALEKLRKAYVKQYVDDNRDAKENFYHEDSV